MTDWGFVVIMATVIVSMIGFGISSLNRKAERIIKLLEAIRDDNATWRNNTWNRDAG